jgi:hypothetical protein
MAILHSIAYAASDPKIQHTIDYILGQATIDTAALPWWWNMFTDDHGHNFLLLPLTLWRRGIRLHLDDETYQSLILFNLAIDRHGSNRTNRTIQGAGVWSK